MKTRMHPIDQQIALIYFDPNRRTPGDVADLRRLVGEAGDRVPVRSGPAATLRAKVEFLVSA